MATAIRTEHDARGALLETLPVIERVVESAGDDPKLDRSEVLLRALRAALDPE